MDDYHKLFFPSLLKIKGMKTLTLTFLFSLILASCGSSNDDEQNRRNQLGNLPYMGQNGTATIQQAQPAPPRTQEELEAETSEELYYVLKASGVNMERIQKGEEVLIRCNGSEILGEIETCRLGFSTRDLQVGFADGSGYLTKGHSEDLYQRIYSEKIRASLMNGDVLSISCEKTCKITDGYQGGRELVDHRRTRQMGTRTGGF